MLLKRSIRAKKHPSKQEQCLGTEATQWLTDRLPAGTELELEFDSEMYDRYGRTLAAVYTDGSLINAELAAEGLGVPKTYGENDKFRPDVDTAHQNAKTGKKGFFDPNIDCTLVAQQQTLETLVDQLPNVPSTADPTAALEEATGVAEQIDSLANGLEIGQIASSGLAIYDAHAFVSALSDLRSETTVAAQKAERRVTALGIALEDWEAEQERIQKEKTEQEEMERAAADAQVQQEQQEREAARQSQREPETAQPAPMPRQTQNQVPAQPALPAERPTAPRTQAPTPATPAPKPSPSPKKDSSCVPFGPEISYANDGGYTGLRYGMPGGKTFRKCS